MEYGRGELAIERWGMTSLQLKAAAHCLLDPNPRLLVSVCTTLSMSQ